ncbi:Transcriptional regulator containing GAF, AAA-type ATPase, and DNA-binding Fis domains [Chitinophaga sp. CF118]|uniref:sigma-54-dependent Fis family transcriptional regulator n=1 Tax=Chitinophaga sp. CF118 TaxID=1884367 RepID=UPI0008E9E97D|nr:sigma 54-interacting transcriptional regulator [Chitinophaga sp. CF118]SFD75027.1 Transcriptional regulator containing GAF, AAA-type ATPase, and DNA-binding Fis domains [Chitinophaga sp. CF118]
MTTNTEASALWESLQEREKEQAVLLSFSNDLAAARDKEDLSRIIHQRLTELFVYDDFIICTVDEEQGLHKTFFHFFREKPKDYDFYMQVISESYPVEDGFYNVVLQSAEVVRFDLAKLLKDKKELPQYIQYQYNNGIREVIAIALHNQKGKVGTFFLLLKNPDTFTTQALRLLQGLSYQLAITIANIIANEKIEKQLQEISHYKQQLEEENLYLQEERNVAYNFSEIVGSGTEMQKIFQLVSQVAAADSTVLLLGETGTGKELIARAIHMASPRKNKLMIKVNCAALPASLIESELFGHERGSFTGASDQRIGKFELANNSTLFLDEIGELPLELQVKLLRVLQEKEIERVGGRKSIKVNVRIIAATNRNLQKEVDAGKFRADLFYRLNVFPITLPPLRNRKEDIPVLTAHFIARYSRNAGKKMMTLSPKVMEELVAYSWPGNVRELEHLVERSVLLTNGTTIKQMYLPSRTPKEPVNTPEEFQILPLDEMERTYILKVLKVCNGRISGPHGAAVKLGLPPTTLISKMQRLGIKKEHFVDRN